MERKGSFFPARLGFLGSLGMLALMGACVSGSIANGTNQHGNSGSQAGSDVQSPSGGDPDPTSTGQQPGGTDGGNTAQAPTALPEEQGCTSDSPGPRLMRRLTAGEFAASIVDLFGGDKTVPLSEVFNDSRVLGFTVDSDTLRVQDLNADQLMTNAEAVANWAVTTQLDKLKTLATCSTHELSCGKLFIKNFGRKAFRTAVPDATADIYNTKLFMTEADFATGVSTGITAMLQSPYFLYRSEIGTGSGTNGTINLTAYEVASSLSYLLTGSMPDETLLKAADTAAAANTEDALKKMVTEQTTRLLAPSGSDPLAPPAQAALMNFMSGWLGLDCLYTNVKDSNSLSDDQRAAMATETKKFILDIWGASTGNTVGDLFSANYTFLNQSLASYYSLQGGMGDTFTKVPLPMGSGRDPGILGQASILIGYSRSDSSSPTQRGHLVRSRILCQDVPMPPAGLDTKFTPNANLKTTRDQYLQGHAAPDHQPCYGCHKVMDPIGVAFEHYDAFGKYRDQENSVTIDDTGTIYAASVDASGKSVDVDIKGVAGLEGYLATSDAVKSCLVRYWSYYAFGKSSWAQDKCTYDAIRKEAQDNSYSLQGVLKAILHSPRFTRRLMDQ